MPDGWDEYDDDWGPQIRLGDEPVADWRTALALIAPLAALVALIVTAAAVLT